MEFTVRAGTTDALAGIGVRNGAGVVRDAYPAMPKVYTGWGWSAAYFKGEGGTINIGLGQGPALSIFNEGIVSWAVAP